MTGRLAVLVAFGAFLTLVNACGRRDGAARETTRVNGMEAVDAGSTQTDTAQLANSGPAASGVAYFSAATLARAADALAGGTHTGRTLRSSGGLQYIVMRRLASGGPEVHDHWADVTFVQSGHGSLVSGGRVSGAAVTAPGEHRGGTIVGGSERAVGPGDLLAIPAGVPHEYRVARGDSLRYITVKVGQPPTR